MRRFHHFLGPLLALPLVLWVVTGLLFHVKHRYGEAYEVLTVQHAAPADWSSAVIAPAQVIGRGLAAAPLVLDVHPSGRLVYFGKKGLQPVAIDAATGVVVPPVSAETARAWVASALAHSHSAHRYGQEISAQPSTMRSARTGTEDPALTLRYSGAKTVRIDLLTGEIAQAGALNEFIDATYRLHYLQWTPWKSVNIALVSIAMPLLLLLAFSGIRMALTRR